MEELIPVIFVALVAVVIVFILHRDDGIGNKSSKPRRNNGLLRAKLSRRF